ncbi:glycosyltransferase [Candidatus Saccharibacteria bacterium]|nr:glycosyltransferase [Candidatus Saccharibacteria bacterium]
MELPKYKTCSVLMAVYHGDQAEWLEQAMQSILGQTTKSNDIVIVRDGLVSDDIEKVLKKHEKRAEVRVVRLAENGGLARALNAGLMKCKNELVARMDADDIMEKDRLKLQIQTFNDDSTLSILGGQVAEFDGDEDNITGYRRVPVAEEEIGRFAKLRCPLNHPSVMFRKSVINRLGGYDEKIGKVEDYELWMRALSDGYVIRNLPDTLCRLRAGDYMIGRRKSWQGCVAQIRLRRHFLVNRWIGLGDFMKTSLAFVVVAIIPTSAVRFVYQKGLRKS